MMDCEGSIRVSHKASMDIIMFNIPLPPNPSPSTNTPPPQPQIYLVQIDAFTLDLQDTVNASSVISSRTNGILSELLL